MGQLQVWKSDPHIEPKPAEPQPTPIPTTDGIVDTRPTHLPSPLEVNEGLSLGHAWQWEGPVPLVQNPGMSP